MQSTCLQNIKQTDVLYFGISGVGVSEISLLCEDGTHLDSNGIKKFARVVKQQTKCTSVVKYSTSENKLERNPPGKAQKKTCRTQKEKAEEMFL